MSTLGVALERRGRYGELQWGFDRLFSMQESRSRREGGARPPEDHAIPWKRKNRGRELPSLLVATGAKSRQVADAK